MNDYTKLQGQSNINDYTSSKVNHDINYLYNLFYKIKTYFVSCHYIFFLFFLSFFQNWRYIMCYNNISSLKSKPIDNVILNKGFLMVFFSNDHIHFYSE